MDPKNKKIERAEKYKTITVDSAAKSCLKAGFLTKRGGRKVNWRRRYCILSGANLYYFKSQKAKSPQGAIEIDKSSNCTELNIPSPKKAMGCSFQIYTTKRTFFIFADSGEEKRNWMDAINKAISNLKGPSPNGSQPSGSTSPAVASSTAAEAAMMNGTQNKPAESVTQTSPAAGSTAIVAPGAKGTSIDKLRAARDAIPWMKKDEKVGEFWAIWLESMPPATEDIRFEISTSLSTEKLGWRSSGAQNVFIQRMVDFFFDVGASEPEIDRLNTLGALMEPAQIGPWIEMSDRQGMDGGWFFPVEISFDKAIQAMDSGPALDKVKEWADRHKIEKCCSVGRDMGAMPPRQATLRVVLPGGIASQMEIAMDAFRTFEVPAIPEGVANIINQHSPKDITLSIVTCPDGFVQLGIWIPGTGKDIVTQLCAELAVTKGVENLMELERSLGKNGAGFIEYKHLLTGFGYGAYKEGFDVMLHYTI